MLVFTVLLLDSSYLIGGGFTAMLQVLVASSTLQDGDS